MSDGDDGAAGEFVLDEARHLLVRHYVHGRGRLVQYQQFGVPVIISVQCSKLNMLLPEDSPAQTEKLPLSHAEVPTTLRYFSVEV